MTPLKDDSRGMYYLVLPESLQTLPDNAGLDDIWPIRGANDYVKVNSEKYISGVDLLTSTFYWYERYTGEQRVYFKNLGLPVCDHLVRMVIAFDKLADTDPIVIPSGLELEVVELMKNFFLGQRQTPEDDRDDGHDDKQQ